MQALSVASPTSALKHPAFGSAGKEKQNNVDLSAAGTDLDIDTSVFQEPTSSTGVSILDASIARDETLLVDASVHPSEEVLAAARDLLNREPTEGWDTMKAPCSRIGGLRFHVYELTQGNEPLIWSYACVYDSSQIRKQQAQLFLQKIVSITEIMRFCDETWRNGEDWACQNEVSPLLMQHIQEFSSSEQPATDDNTDCLELSQRIARANQNVLNECNRRKLEQEAKNEAEAKTSLKSIINLSYLSPRRLRFGSQKRTVSENPEQEDLKRQENDSERFDATPSKVKAVGSNAVDKLGSAAAHYAPPLSPCPTTTGLKKAALTLSTRQESAQAEKETAAKRIQSHWRGTMDRHKYASTLQCIVVIQSVARGYACRKRTMLLFDCYLHQLRSASLGAFSCQLLRKRARQQYAAVLGSIALIPPAVRGYAKRQRVFLQVISAISIQRHYRGYREGRKFNHQRLSAVIIQRYYRGYLGRCNFVHHRLAAVVIERYCRGYLGRRNFSHQLRSAVVIERNYRGYRERRNFSQHRRAAISIQRHYRGYLGRHEFSHQRLAAISIQKHYRCFQESRKFNHKRLAAVVIQQYYRCFNESCKFKSQRRSAVVIQQYYRGYQDSRKFRHKRQSTVAIQRYYRGFRQSQKFSHQRRSAVAIQRYFRGYLGRRNFSRQLWSVVVIQRYFRGYLGRRVSTCRRRSAVFIRSHWFINRRSSPKVGFSLTGL